MKYHPPKQGSYESGLTAGSLYNIVHGLISRHITQEDIVNTNKKYKTNASEKLWEKPEVRSELEEFVTSYFFDGLQTPIPGFGEVFKGNLQARKEHLEGYASALEQHYSSRDKANNRIRELFEELEKRGNRLYGEIPGIRYLEEEKLSMDNAIEAFRQIAFAVYGRVEGVMEWWIEKVTSQS